MNPLISLSIACLAGWGLGEIAQHLFLDGKPETWLRFVLVNAITRIVAFGIGWYMANHTERWSFWQIHARIVCK